MWVGSPSRVQVTMIVEIATWYDGLILGSPISWYNDIWNYLLYDLIPWWYTYTYHFNGELSSLRPRLTLFNAFIIITHTSTCGTRRKTQLHSARGINSHFYSYSAFVTDDSHYSSQVQIPNHRSRIPCRSTALIFVAWHTRTSILISIYVA